MSIVTRTGDDGISGLLTGERVSKGSDRIEAYGTVDELNAVLGVCIAEIDSSGSSADESHGSRLRLHDCLLEIQRILFIAGADLAAPLLSKARINRVSGKEIETVEKWIDELEQALPELKRFIIPGGSVLSAHLHLARTVCRRAERCVVRLSEKEKINKEVLNRLSDYLFMAARHDS